MTVPAVVRRLRDILDSREDRNPTAVRTSRVVGRNEDGTLRLQRIDGECVARGCVTPEGEGEMVRRPAGACWGNQGTSGIALASVRGAGRFLWVERIEPEVFEAGSSLTVTVHGRGLSTDTVFDFLLPGGEDVNPYITQTAIRWVSDREMEIDIEVSELAPVLTTAPLAYDKPGTPI